MIIGNGLIARTFNSYRDEKSVLIFASGISNSKENKNSEYDREQKLLIKSLKENQSLLFVYFSTCSIYDSSLCNSKYVKHKLHMESLVKDKHPSYLILRLPNVVGKGGNSNTLINYFVSSIKNEHEFGIWKNSSRNILDTDDVYYIVNRLILSGAKNQTINTANPNNYKINDIVSAIEKRLNISGKYYMIDEGEDYFIDTEKIKVFLNDLNKDFSINYLNEILKKYYY